MPKVSLIVPVYNVEKYINRCIDSLISQSLKDIEIILVDDESPDNCGAICDEYAKKDRRIKVIHKKNGGLGFARNSGLEAAEGEFSAFVDSDDYVSLDMYEKLYLEAKKNDADTCLCGSTRIYSTGSTKVSRNPLGHSVYQKDNVITGVLINMLGSPPEFHSDDYLGMSVLKGIYSNSIIKANNLRFCSEREFISEDIIFNIDYFKWAQCVAVIPDALYYHCQNQSSLTQAYKADRFQKDKVLYNALLRQLEDMDILDAAKQRIDRTFISRSRICIIQEVTNAEKIGVRKAKDNVRSICSDKTLQDVLYEYPIFKLPLKQRIFTLCTKMKMTDILFALVRQK
ncbi:MAG: glycosyltransferase [Clostridiaceae bacterium]